MAGNSQRRGATRKPGSKKGASAGSGGRNRRALEGKGPTPKAEERTYHPAGKRKAAAERAAAKDAARGGQAARSGQTERGGQGDRGARAPSRSGDGRRPSPRTGGTRPGSRATQELVTGRNAVLEALRAEIPATSLQVAHAVEADERFREVLRIAQRRQIPLLEVTRAELDRLTDNAVHQGLALQVPPYSYAHPEDLLDVASDAGAEPLIIALDGVTDPRNLGAVLRSAGAFGAHGVVVPARRSAGVTAAAWKVSAGAAARVPVAQAGNLVQALQAYRAAGCFIVGLDAGGAVEIASVQLATDPLVLVVGSEGKGLSRLVRENCDMVASIPIAASTESLNAGVAAGIALYEVARLRSA